MWYKFFLLLFYLTSVFSIQGKQQRLNWHNTEKVRDQIDIIEKLWTKLKYGVKNMDHLCNLPFKLLIYKSQIHSHCIFFFFFFFYEQTKTLFIKFKYKKYDGWGLVLRNKNIPPSKHINQSSQELVLLTSEPAYCLVI